MVTHHTASPITANARGPSAARTRGSRPVVSPIAVMAHTSGLAPAFTSPICSRFHAARQGAEQNRACSRRGANAVPHCSQLRISAIGSSYAWHGPCRIQRCGNRDERRLAAEHGLDPREKVAPGEGLGHIVIGAKSEPARPVDLGVLGGQHDHRHIRPFTQTTAHLCASCPGEHEVEQDQVGPVEVECLQRIGAGRADGDLEALLAQHVRKGVADRLLVLDNEHKCHVTALAGFCGAKARQPPGRGAGTTPMGLIPAIGWFRRSAGSSVASATGYLCVLPMSGRGPATRSGGAVSCVLVAMSSRLRPAGSGSTMVRAKPAPAPPAVSSSVPRRPNQSFSSGNRKTPMKAASLPMPAEIPCPVARMVTGYNSLGMTKVVMFGPNSVKK